MNALPPALRGWVPVLARADGPTLAVELCRLGQRRFAEPFFEDTLAACMQRPFHNAFRQRLDIETLAQWVGGHPGLQIGGLVFHMSRCGSTLLSQWLAAAPAHRVMSEPPPLDAALRAGNAPDEPTRVRWLQAMVGLLGQTTRDEEKRLFIKFDSWHAHHLPLVQRSFPQVPWLFLMREPVEVLVSHLRRPGAQMVPGLLAPALPGLDTAVAAGLPREVYAAHVLGGICEAVDRVLAQSPGAGLVLDYTQLPAALEGSLSRHFGMRPDAATRQRMAQVLARDAKNPQSAHAPDSAAKRLEATPAVRDAAASWIEPSYRRLLARTTSA